MLNELIDKAKDLCRVVILIDEYDKPLDENIDVTKFSKVLVFYIFEFKMSQPAKVVIAHIKEKEFAIPYLSDSKPNPLIGINFSKGKLNIVECLEEEMG